MMTYYEAILINSIFLVSYLIYIIASKMNENDDETYFF